MLSVRTRRRVFPSLPAPSPRARRGVGAHRSHDRASVDRVFRKLALDSREQLPRVLAGGTIKAQLLRLSGSG